ncbi:phospholipase [Lacticaseibacillus chiayiensis]|uniref:phospholipase n=1 Tax=Lacticaseibacillus chiayiensis TaxID=2100821 RepID=UPI001BCC99D1|nr:phospholipase [Lacticaseibacillus chiayiensis]QVI34638.1 phospholipase [Lacticaseibacillus chiayiensis]
MKKIIVILGALLGVFLYSGQSVSASTQGAGLDDSLTDAQRAAVETVEKFIEFDDNGIPEVNVEAAFQANSSEETVKYANQINALSNSVKSEGVEVTVQRVKRALFPIGAWGNYCGAGNKGWNKRPVHNLDQACREHDKCFQGFSMKSAACNRAFIRRLLPIIQREGFSPKGLYARAAKTLFSRWI